MRFQYQAFTDNERDGEMPPYTYDALHRLVDGTRDCPMCPFGNVMSVGQGCLHTGSLRKRFAQKQVLTARNKGRPSALCC